MNTSWFEFEHTLTHYDGERAQAFLAGRHTRRPSLLRRARRRS
ncbi:hypothetical protein [Serinibacter arcticus]|nr:hypothetical protein [Serinibacter arcticus]